MKVCSRCKFPKLPVEMAKQLGSPDGYSSWCKACYRTANKVPNLERARIKQQAMNALKAKPCADCGEVFPPCCMDFDHVRGTKRDGLGRLLTCSSDVVQGEIAKCDLVCAVCHRLRTFKSTTAAKNKKYLAFLEKIAPFKDLPCVDCGRRYPSACMDFDHVRGVKVLPISKMFSSAWVKVLEEIAKCDLVCANCHRTRTMARRAA